MLLGSLQESLLALLTYDEAYFQRIRNAVEINLYGGPYRLVATRLYDYIDKFKKPPKEHLVDLLTDKLEGKNKADNDLYLDIVASIERTHKSLNVEYVMSQLEVFIKRQTYRTLGVDLMRALQRDTEEGLDEV